MRSRTAAALAGFLTLASLATGAEVKETYEGGKLKHTYTTDAAGKKVGAETFYSPGGKTRAVVNYTAGERTGSVTFYDDAGKRRLLLFPRPVSAIEKAWSELYPYEPLAPAYDIEPVLTPPYRAGVLKKDVLQQAVRFVRLYRFLAGLSTTINENPQLSLRSSAASVLLNKLGTLTHTPARPDDMPEPFFKMAAEGCAHSNIFQGTGEGDTLIESIRCYMDDSDGGNMSRVGHRQWLMNPTMNAIGFGFAGKFSATWAHAESKGPSSIRYATFPAEGFYPQQLLEKHHVWSFHYNPQLFTIPDRGAVKVRVEQLDDNWEKVADIPTSLVNVFTDAGWPSHVIIFKPDLKQITPARYIVEITGLKPKLGDPTICYAVELVSMEAVKQAKAPATAPAAALR
jgi:hypothetical protein